MHLNRILKGQHLTVTNSSQNKFCNIAVLLNSATASVVTLNQYYWTARHVWCIGYFMQMSVFHNSLSHDIDDEMLLAWSQSSSYLRISKAGLNSYWQSTDVIKSSSSLNITTTTTTTTVGTMFMVLVWCFIPTKCRPRLQKTAPARIVRATVPVSADSSHPVLF